MTAHNRKALGEWAQVARDTWIVVISVYVVFPMGVSSCTVAPKLVAPPSAPAFHGNTQNAGVFDLGPIGPNGRPLGPAHVDVEWVREYRVLLQKYGKSVYPMIEPEDGITALADGTFHADLEQVSAKNVMASLERSGIAP